MASQIHLNLFILFLSTKFLENLGEVPTSTNCSQYALDYCSSCYNPDVLCYECPTGYTLKTDKTGCTACSTNCEICTLSTDGINECTQCTSGFRLDDGQCIACTSECAFCTALSTGDVQCDTCKTSGTGGFKYVQSVDKTKCLACPANCEKCESDAEDKTSCSECKTGFTIKTDYTCIACSSNCETCSEMEGVITTCWKCEAGFVKDSTNTVQCLECPSTCTTCSTDRLDGSSTIAKCTGCMTGYALNNDECTACDSHCTACSAPDYCTECDDFYYETLGVCTACSLHCTKCDVLQLNGNGDPSCSACTTGYTLKPTAPSSCDPCPANCKRCRLDGRCISCVDTYRLGPDEQCQACTDRNCEWCSSSLICSRCMPGYKLYNDACYECPSGCSDGNCAYDVGLSGAACLSCDLQTGTTLNTNTGQCDACPNDCAACSHNSTADIISCTKCEDNFGVDDSGQCIACGLGCTDCIYNATIPSMQCVCIDRPAPGEYEAQWVPSGQGFRGECTAGSAVAYACSDGYYLDDTTGQCLECTVDGCSVCNNTVSSAVTCAVCEEKYAGPSSTGQCTACSYKCVNCSYDITEYSTECIECDIRYGLTATNTCTICQHVKCLACSFNPTDGSETCQQCDQGYIIDPNSASACLSCPPYCTSCSHNGTQTVCDSNGCQGGTVYYAGSCYACPAQCTSCIYDVGLGDTSCTQCDPLYAINAANQCDKCPDKCSSCAYIATPGGQVLTCDDGSCDVGFGIKPDGKCHACQKNCLSCTYSDTAQSLDCDQCSDNYVINDQQCAVCPDDCLSCQSVEGSVSCTLCSPGYYTNALRECSKCGTGCTQCYSSTNCSLCEDGYGLRGDGICYDCVTLSRDSACVSCTGTGVCQRCSADKVLSEDNFSCKDGNAVSGVCAMKEDRGWQCTQCEEGRFIAPDGRCAFECYTCLGGGLADDDSCNKDNSQFSTEMCYFGYCWGYLIQLDDKNWTSRSCSSGQCNSDSQTESCSSTSTDSICNRCCVGSKCNNFVLIGGATRHWSTGMLKLSLLLLFAGHFV